MKICGSTPTSDAPDLQRSFALFEGFQALPARPFEKTSKDAEMNVYLADVLFSRIVMKHVLIVLRSDVVSDRPHQFSAIYSSVTALLLSSGGVGHSATVSDILLQKPK